MAAAREAVAEQDDRQGGTYRLELVRCGKDRCTRCADGPAHGPYWYRYYRGRGGKLVSRYVGKTLPAAGADYLATRGDISAGTARELSQADASGPGQNPDSAPRTGVWARQDSHAEAALPAAQDAARTAPGTPVSDRIRAACRVLALEPGDFVRLTDLRRALPGTRTSPVISRDERRTAIPT
jgi:hypothetical protein